MWKINQKKNLLGLIFFCQGHLGNLGLGHYNFGLLFNNLVQQFCKALFTTDVRVFARMISLRCSMAAECWRNRRHHKRHSATFFYKSPESSETSVELSCNHGRRALVQIAAVGKPHDDESLLFALRNEIYNSRRKTFNHFHQKWLPHHNICYLYS